MSIQNPPKHPVIRWTTIKGLATLFLFIVITALTESLVVLYAINLGVKDETLLQWSFKFIGTDWNMTLAISPLFHLVPIAVVVTLASCWVYLARHMATKPKEMQRGIGTISRREKKQKEKHSGGVTSTMSKAKGFAYLEKRIHFARTNIRSALMILIIFSALILAISLLAYPQLVHRTITSAYQSNPSLLSFIKGTGDAFASLGSVFSALNNALLANAPSFRNFVLGLGDPIGPLASLDNSGKYLVLQNSAAWISALVTLLYGKLGRKGYQHRKK
jgi:hypothetical protein